MLLQVKCEKQGNTIVNETIYADQLIWVPIGNQRTIFKDIKPVHDKVIIAKLRENQEIECELICEKNQGRVHAKWSPVASAYYKLLPDIELQPMNKEEAKKTKINLSNECL